MDEVPATEVLEDPVHGLLPSALVNVTFMVALVAVTPGVRDSSCCTWVVASLTVGVAASASPSAPARAPFCTASWTANARAMSAPPRSVKAMSGSISATSTIDWPRSSRNERTRCPPESSTEGFSLGSASQLAARGGDLDTELNRRKYQRRGGGVVFPGGFWAPPR